MNFEKNIFYLSMAFVVICFSCSSETKSFEGFQQVSGNTMGTTYECTFDGAISADVIQLEIDSLLELINDAASTYRPESLISFWNQSEAGLCRSKEDAQAIYFQKIMEISNEVVSKSSGYFDPTLMPLVNYWGFGYKESVERASVDSDALDSILKYTGFELVKMRQTENEICWDKSNPKTELDFSAVAKGYAVDLIAQYFNDNNVHNYYINIGGEVVVKGHNKEMNQWKLGVSYPDTSAQLNELYASVGLSDGAMASSGNYRNYYVSNGIQRVHTIHPQTGLASPSDLQGVTIIAKDCATADAFATACMSMGYQRSKALIDSLDNIEGFFIYSDDSITGGLKHYISPGLKENLKLN